jgi:two-component system secretion response regulator SsrB
MMLGTLLALDGRFDLVGEAANGKQGVAACGETQPDLVVLDREMPVMGGLAALPLIRQVAPGARVLVFSSHPDDMEQEVLERGASRYLVKGTDLDDVVDALAALVAPPVRR